MAGSGGIGRGTGIRARGTSVRGSPRWQNGVRWAWLYRRGLGAHLRSTLEYESDFWMLILSAALVQAVGLIFLQAIFSRVPRLGGWTLSEVVMITSLVVLAEGMNSLLTEATWWLPWQINQGEVDYLLVRPCPVVVQVLSSRVGLNGLGNVTCGGGMLVWAVVHSGLSWGPARCLALVVMLVCAVLIKGSITLISSCISFWTGGWASSLSGPLHEVGDLARYPLTIYSGSIRVLLTVVIPFGFVSFFPASALLRPEQYWWAGPATVLVTIYCLGMARWTLRRGLLRYESTGS